jgi:hypothetical protein
MSDEIMPLAVTSLKSISFETRKDFVALFNHLVRHDTQRFATHYLAHHSGVLYQIVDGYASTEIALNCGTMLRECVKVSELLHVLLYGTVSAAGARARAHADGESGAGRCRITLVSCRRRRRPLPAAPPARRMAASPSPSATSSSTTSTTPTLRWRRTPLRR